MDYKFYMVNGNFIFLLIMGNRYADVKRRGKEDQRMEKMVMLYIIIRMMIYGKESKKTL